MTSVGHRRYDVVVSDCFGGDEPARELATVEALRLARGSLNPGGIYAANIVSANEGSDVSFLRDCAATALEVFDHAWVIPCGDAEFGGEENYLLIASDSDYAFTEAVPFDNASCTPPVFLAPSQKDWFYAWLRQPRTRCFMPSMSRTPSAKPLRTSSSGTNSS